jgi:hypothetical protein
MTVQITDEQVDIELMVVRATLDEVLAARSQSGQKDD